MRPSGFTLIELLIVISIIAIMSLVGFVNFKNFATDQITTKAIGQIKTLLRLAQSNATSSTICNGEGATSWSLIFNNDGQTIELHCSYLVDKITTDYKKDEVKLENATLTISGSSNCAIGLPTTISYSVSKAGALSIVSDDQTTQTICLQSDTITFKLTNLKNPTASPLPSFNISKGGAINVN